MSFVHYIQVRHFPCPSISDLAIWSIIFQVCHFPPLRLGPSFSESVNFRTCYLVRHFLGPSFSGLAIWSVIFLSCNFRSCIFSYPNPCTVKAGGKITPRPLFLLPFPNRLELKDAAWPLFLNMNWLQDGAFRPYLTHSRNPIWRPENRKCFEISLLQDN